MLSLNDGGMTRLGCELRWLILNSSSTGSTAAARQRELARSTCWVVGMSKMVTATGEKAGDRQAALGPGSGPALTGRRSRMLTRKGSRARHLSICSSCTGATTAITSRRAEVVPPALGRLRMVDMRFHRPVITGGTRRARPSDDVDGSLLPAKSFGRPARETSRDHPHTFWPHAFRPHHRRLHRPGHAGSV